MKWSRVNPNCIRAGEYTISRYTLGGTDLFHVYHAGQKIGEAPDGNRARKVAEKHAAGEKA